MSAGIGSSNRMKLKQGSMVPDTTDIITCHTAFSLSTRLVEHLPVCGWFCVACRILKRRASLVTKGLDVETRDTLLSV